MIEDVLDAPSQRRDIASDFHAQIEPCPAIRLERVSRVDELRACVDRAPVNGQAIEERHIVLNAEIRCEIGNADGIVALVHAPCRVFKLGVNVSGPSEYAQPGNGFAIERQLNTLVSLLAAIGEGIADEDRVLLGNREEAEIRAEFVVLELDTNLVLVADDRVEHFSRIRDRRAAEPDGLGRHGPTLQGLRIVSVDRYLLGRFEHHTQQRCDFMPFDIALARSRCGVERFLLNALPAQPSSHQQSVIEERQRVGDGGAGRARVLRRQRIGQIATD